MGLTSSSTGSKILTNNLNLLQQDSDFTVTLAGNPNVGKSTVFNGLTGLNQHTGNWTGKTVSNAAGKCTYLNKKFLLVDIPGTYSIISHSKEEEIARDFICSGVSDVTVVVVDATCLERNLNLVFQIMDITPNVIVCVNLLDEAKKKKIKIDLDLLSELLGVPVVGTTARKKKSLNNLLDTIYKVCNNEIEIFAKKIIYPENCSLNEKASCIMKQCEYITNKVCSFEKSDYRSSDKKIDKFLTSKTFGIPIMILFLGLIFWITIIGANYPSSLLSEFFGSIQEKLIYWANYINMPSWLSSMLILGVYQTVTWIVAVMLPPMAIFFPLFTILEDLGYLPRIAFNMDKCFKKACTNGKQMITMCMGFGCNAAGVCGCKIIDSPRERLIAILTNVFVPCNGRFPFLITISTIFIASSFSGITASIVSTLSVIAVIILGIFMSLLISRLLSKTILKGMPSSFILELPPYRKPQFGRIIVRSIFDRTLFVLGRALSVAVPAGFVIWIFANIGIDGSSLLSIIANFLNPFAKLMGLDGYILTAFILALPANEIVLPIILMGYLGGTSLNNLSDTFAIGNILVQNGWTILTAINVMIFVICHFPCGTTLLTIKKETGSWKWTGLAFVIPTVCGILLCICTTLVYNIFV